MLTCRGFLPPVKLVCYKILCYKIFCYKIVVNVVGVCENPLTKSLAHLAKAFCYKSNTTSKAFCLPPTS